MAHPSPGEVETSPQAPPQGMNYRSFLSKNMALFTAGGNEDLEWGEPPSP